MWYNQYRKSRKGYDVMNNTVLRLENITKSYKQNEGFLEIIRDSSLFVQFSQAF